jgi:hypothetical protein
MNYDAQELTWDDEQKNYILNFSADDDITGNVRVEIWDNDKMQKIEYDIKDMSNWMNDPKNNTAPLAYLLQPNPNATSMFDNLIPNWEIIAVKMVINFFDEVNTDFASVALKDLESELIKLDKVTGKMIEPKDGIYYEGSAVITLPDGTVIQQQDLEIVMSLKDEGFKGEFALDFEKDGSKYTGGVQFDQDGLIDSKIEKDGEYVGKILFDAGKNAYYFEDKDGNRLEAKELLTM